MRRLTNPYAVLGGPHVALRGNLHTHTTLSDGSLEPQGVVSTYARLGYDFLAITDHDRHADTAVMGGLDPKGMLLIPGNEITAAGPHLLHVGSGRKVDPYPDRQAVVDVANASGGFVLVNHPNWEERFDHCPMTDLERWRGYLGIEIFNGVICRLTGSPYAAGKWDMLLSKGRKVLGFANDDFHDPGAGDLARGWNVAFCRERTVASLMGALIEGAFYASTGVAIRRIEVKDRRVLVETTNAQTVVALTDHGHRIATSRGRTLTVEMPPEASYLRFECHGEGESMAWTQPFRWEDTGA